jgi:hypothetical protein
LAEIMAQRESPGYRLQLLGRVACIFTGLAIAGVLAAAISVEPDPRGYGTHERLGLPPCGFHLMFNFPCPSCGGTTSFAHFVRGQWPAAFVANPAAFLLALVSVVAAPWLSISALLGRLWRVEDPFRLLAIVTASLVSVAILHWLAKISPALGALAR